MWFYALIGFAGFEALRIYKKLWASTSVPPLGNRWLYLVIVAMLAVFVGTVVTVLNIQNRGLAVYIGFSVPTNAKMLLSREFGQELEVDDTQVGHERFGANNSFWQAVLDYF